MADQWSAGEERLASQYNQTGTSQHPQPGAVPEPEPQLERLPGPASGGVGKWIAGAIVSAALLAGLGYGMGWFSPAPSPPPAAIAATAAAPAKQGFSLLQQVSLADQASALQALVMSDADKGAVTKAVQKGAVQLAWLAFSDSGTEDGDIVTVSGANFNQTVPLLKAQTRLAVPYIPGTPIKVIASKDGFAPGVTVAVYVGGSVFKLKTMKEGEAVEIATP